MFFGVFTHTDTEMKTRTRLRLRQALALDPERQYLNYVKSLINGVFPEPHM